MKFRISCTQIFDLLYKEMFAFIVQEAMLLRTPTYLKSNISNM